MARVLSIDPGKSKCGLVLAQINEKKVYEATVLNSEFLEDYIKNLNNVEDISKIIIGNGTTSGEIIKKLDCFCFTQQEIRAGETRQLPVVFVIDPEVPSEVHTITLSFTMFEVEGRGAINDGS